MTNKTSNMWKTYIGMQVKLIIEDKPFPRTKDGLFMGIDDTHVFLQTEFKDEPIPFSRVSVKRVELNNKEHKEYGKGT